jgi:tRNA(Ile)-lysidine synthase
VYNGGAVEIRRSVFAISDGRLLKAVHKTQEEPKKNTDIFSVENGRMVCIANKKFTPFVINTDEFNNRKKINKNLFYNSLDYDTIPLTGVFRTRRAGDVFSLPKRNVTKTVKKLFTEMKVPKEQRDSIVMLADGNEIMWIEGTGASEKYKVNAGTSRVLVILTDEEVKQI